MLQKRLSENTGQVIVLVALAMTMLMGIAAVVVDIGYAYAAQRNLQSSADAAALAGAEGLPDIGNAVTFARAVRVTDGQNTHGDLGVVSESVTTACVVARAWLPERRRRRRRNRAPGHILRARPRSSPLHSPRQGGGMSRPAERQGAARQHRIPAPAAPRLPRRTR